MTMMNKNCCSKGVGPWKIIKVSLLGICTVLLLTVIAALLIWNGELRSLASIRQVGDDSYLYEMEYKAGYDLDKVLDAGIDENEKLVSYVIGQLSRGLYKPQKLIKVSGEFGCTSFQAKNSQSDGYLFGRNYDYFQNPSLVLKSHPHSGYSSISTCDLSHLGYGLEKVPDTFLSKALCLAAIYAPMDGMNEKGLCISIMALPKMAARQDTGKKIAGTSIIMRLILDRCATVQEAIDLVNSLDIRHDQKAGSGYHYLVADAFGDAAVIEFDKEDNWKTCIIRKNGEYLHVTNHLLSPKYYTEIPDQSVGNTHSKSWERYTKVRDYLDSLGGQVTPEQAQECLSNVHWVDLVWENGLVENTQWSNVYDQSALSLKLRHWNDYDVTRSFGL